MIQSNSTAGNASRTVSFPSSPFKHWVRPIEPMIRELAPFVAQDRKLTKSLSSYGKSAIERHRAAIHKRAVAMELSPEDASEQIHQFERTAKECVAIIKHQAWRLYIESIEPRVVEIIAALRTAHNQLGTDVEVIERMFAEEYGYPCNLRSRVIEEANNIATLEGLLSSGMSAERVREHEPITSQLQYLACMGALREELKKHEVRPANPEVINTPSGESLNAASELVYSPVDEYNAILTVEDL